MICDIMGSILQCIPRATFYTAFLLYIFIPELLFLKRPFKNVGYECDKQESGNAHTYGCTWGESDCAPLSSVPFMIV